MNLRYLLIAVAALWLNACVDVGGAGDKDPFSLADTNTALSDGTDTGTSSASEPLAATDSETITDNPEDDDNTETQDDNSSSSSTDDTETETDTLETDTVTITDSETETDTPVDSETESRLESDSITASETAEETDSLLDAGDEDAGPEKDAGHVEWDTACGDAEATFQLHIPTVMLVVDQSSSMTTAFGGTDRWTAVGETLLDPTNGLVSRLENKVRFGLEMYSGGDTCPNLNGVAPALNNYSAINQVFSANTPAIQTPTGEALQQVIDIVRDDPSEYEKIIVLATDGEPDTCANPNEDNGQPEALAGAQAAWEQGFPLYIISVGNEIGEEHLNQMANAGQGYPVDADAGAAPYVALEPQALEEAFWNIILGSRACVLSLDGKVANGLEGKCEVAVDGTPIVLGGEDGWRLNNPGEVEILGATCESILDGSLSTITVTCPCGVILV